MSTPAPSGSWWDPEQRPFRVERLMPARAALWESFGVGPADLDANRAGHLGPRQRRAARHRAAQRIAGLGGLALVVIGVTAAVRGPLWTWAVAAGPLVAVGLGIAVLVRGARASRTVEVRRLTGVVTVMLLHRHNRGWWLTVEGRSFRLPIPFSDVVTGDPYHVYYRPDAHRIVAMEPAPEVVAPPPAEAPYPDGLSA